MIACDNLYLMQVVINCSLSSQSRMSVCSTKKHLITQNCFVNHKEANRLSNSTNLGSSTVPFVLFVFWPKLGFAESELIWLSILCAIVHLLNKHSSIDRFRTIRESTSFPFSPCSSTRTIAGEKPGDGRTLVREC